MVLHIVIISLQCAAIAAFLLLWYFWTKKKIETSYLLEDEEHILFPFRYFSWLLIGVILATSVAQIHFVRASSVTQEKIAAILAQNKPTAQQNKAVEDLKGLLEKTKRDMDANFKNLRAQITDRGLQAKSLQTIADLSHSSDKSPDKEGFVRSDASRLDSSSGTFAKEAKAFSSAGASAGKIEQPKAEGDEHQEYSMRLNRQGKILRDQVRVRQKPSVEATPVDRLMTGQPVKVTEKKLDTDGRIWFRVITPSGRAGWIDWRFVKLEGSN